MNSADTQSRGDVGNIDVAVDAHHSYAAET